MSADRGLRSELIARQASTWFVRNVEGGLTAAERAQFARWLAESPAHMREYLGVAETWGELEFCQCWPDQSSAALVEELRAAAAAKVVALSGGLDDRESSDDAWHRRKSRLRFAALAASIALLPIALILMWWIGRTGDEYVTQRGEQRSVVLADGSVVQLNTLTRMVVRFDDHERRIELPQGEAFFRVARDPHRPFYVKTPSAIVRAVGTEFNVYARPRSTRVAVVEGKVQVARVELVDETRKRTSRSIERPASKVAAPVPIALTAHESIAISKDQELEQPVIRRVPDALVATAWIQRRLVFEDERVDRAVEEFNRYNQLQIRVLDPQLGALRISGVFNADDPQTLVTYLQRIHGVTAISGADGLMLSGADRML
jgi:transmembrane sensor